MQCKRYSGELKLNDIEAEVANAEGHLSNLATLYLATTAHRDAVLQQQVRTMSNQRIAQGKFAVALLYWDDIIASLVLNAAAFHAHYPQVSLVTPQAADRERRLAALELGYYGSDIWAYVTLMFGEAGWLAQSDPDELIAKLEILDRRAEQLFTPQDGAPIRAAIVGAREGCLTSKAKDEDWHPVEFHAKRASKRLEDARSLLPIAESNILDIGLQLGHIYHHVDDVPEGRTVVRMAERIRAVLSSDREAAIADGLEFAAAARSGDRWATRLFTFLDHELRYSATS